MTGRKINLTELRPMRDAMNGTVRVDADALLALVEAVEAASVYRAHMEAEPSLDDFAHVEWESVSYQLESALDNALARFDFAPSGLVAGKDNQR